ncbi:MAG: maleylacetoacetate isomerase [Nitratireductor sp.]|nr:maleylacetoacetate isomerase [Nitratireductor sp.]
MELYTYFRSSAAYRVRIALNLKGIEAQLLPVHLVRGGGEQHGEAYRGVNPAGLVPALATDSGAVLTQSLAICEYLEEIRPEPPLLPGNCEQRGAIRAFALSIACDIHPLNNSRVMKYLGGELGIDKPRVDIWYRHWISLGFAALEAGLERANWQGPFAFGSAPSLAEICLVPQMYNARRFETDLEDFPRLVAIDAACNALQAFRDAAPENQQDAE